MSIIAWILLGLIAGFIGGQIVHHTGRGLLGDIVVGILGALLGGFLFQLIGAQGVTGLNLWSLFVAVVGSVVLLLLYFAIQRRSATWRRPPA